ncbi:MAG: hypothetical protein SGJ13_01290, partial [Actinomycetota bacterium]|nr:hypothetical protein [Actinomycetota bacterium]
MNKTTRSTRAALAALLLAAPAVVVALDTSPADAVQCAGVLTTPGTNDCTFAPGVTAVTVDVYGAQGAAGQPGAGGTGNGGAGANGQRVTATIAVGASETLRVNVGGQASNATGGASGQADMN